MLIVCDCKTNSVRLFKLMLAIGIGNYLTLSSLDRAGDDRKEEPPISALLSMRAWRKETETRFGSALRASFGIIDRRRKTSPSPSSSPCHLCRQWIICSLLVHPYGLSASILMQSSYRTDPISRSITSATEKKDDDRHHDCPFTRDCEEKGTPYRSNCSFLSLREEQ